MRYYSGDDGALERGVIFYVAALLGSFLTAASFLKLGHAAYIGKTSKENDTVTEAAWPMLIPMLTLAGFCVLFGLSMDYEVFLLSRVKEEFDRTGDPKGSVADGLAATARVITAAAAIMIVVFAGFVLEDNRIIKMFGLGLASAVFLDATFVRMLLVPATMELLGDKTESMLQHLCDVIRLTVRATDTVGRLDPTTFAVVLPHADAERATAVAERLTTSLAYRFTLRSSDAASRDYGQNVVTLQMSYRL